MSATQSWPKDRVLYNRLEQLVYCVEHNEWPSAATIKSLRGGGGDCASDFGDSPSQRSSPSSTPKHAATPGPTDFPDNFIDERISPKVRTDRYTTVLNSAIEGFFFCPLWFKAGGWHHRRVYSCNGMNFTNFTLCIGTLFVRSLQLYPVAGLVVVLLL